MRRLRSGSGTVTPLMMSNTWIGAHRCIGMGSARSRDRRRGGKCLATVPDEREGFLSSWSLNSSSTISPPRPVRGIGIDDFGIEMIVDTCSTLLAIHSEDTRGPDDFSASVNIDGLYSSLFRYFAHLVGPRFRAKSPPELEGFKIQSMDGRPRRYER
jgi:hypothetical protein